MNWISIGLIAIGVIWILLNIIKLIFNASDSSDYDELNGDEVAQSYWIMWNGRIDTWLRITSILGGGLLIIQGAAGLVAL